VVDTHASGKGWGGAAERPDIPVKEVAADLGRRHGVKLTVRLSGLLVPQRYGREREESDEVMIGRTKLGVLRLSTGERR
jgi:hypothetical protein